jgi:conjugal transfer pilin signal peptidase TrbI
MQRKSNRKWLPPGGIILIMATALAVGLWLPAHISVTLTPSLGHRIFFLSEPESRDFKEGDYLLFHKQLVYAPLRGNQAQTDRLLKMVGCAAGQRLRIESGEYYCDEKYLGHALANDSKGKPLPQFIYNGSVPVGTLFMVGNHPRSYDSKYFGFIHADSVLKKAYPIW